MNLSSKLEIKQIVDLAGPSEQLKPCQTESVLLLDKNYKPEFPLKTLFLAVIPAETDVMVDTLMLLGISGLKMVLLLEIYKMLLNGAILMNFQPVTTTAPELLNLVEPLLKLPNANKLVNLDMKKVILMTRPLELLAIEFQVMLKLFKLNFSPTDLLKLLSQSTLIFPHTKVEFITMLLDLLWEDTLLN